VQCQSCSQWLHGRCLEEQAVRDAHDEQAQDQPGQGKKKVDRKSTGGVDFIAQYSELGGGKVCLTVTDKRPRQKNRRWNVDVNCPMCHALIEKAAEDVPPEANMKKKVATTANENITLPSREAPAQPKQEESQDSVVGKDDTPNVPTSATAGPADTPVEPKPNGESTTEPPPSA
jgi:hypothetical protein